MLDFSETGKQLQKSAFSITPEISEECNTIALKMLNLLLELCNEKSPIINEMNEEAIF